MMELPFRLTWLDARAELFPTELPPVIEVLRPTDPVASVARAPSGTRFIIMTHSHPLDYALCHAILRRDDVSWVGLIGSHSKAARFRSRLARDGLTIESISRLQCPIGVEGILSKWPSAIAVGIAAQLMQTLEAKPLDSPVTPNPGPVVTSCADAGCSGCREHSAPTT
jgi:xanthine dehydrogenase accessory factor